MENPHHNKLIAEVFVRYLEREYGWKYAIELPQEVNNPQFDVRLDANGLQSLLLQLKEPVGTFVSREKIFTKSYMKSFTHKQGDVEHLVEEAQNKYRNNARNLILILHKSDTGYLIPSDAEVIDRNQMASSSFQGIYMVSRRLEGSSPQEEFVSTLKDAFADYSATL